jgi:NAD-dependent dihydropyrimidine dehydrogenase PreA subunit
MNFNDANHYILEKGLTEQHKKGIIYIDERKGECTRCKFYCPVRVICKFNKEG